MVFKSIIICLSPHRTSPHSRNRFDYHRATLMAIQVKVEIEFEFLSGICIMMIVVIPCRNAQRNARKLEFQLKCLQNISERLNAML